MLSLLIKAFVFGVAVAAPMGPMGVMCMRRILKQGWKVGLATALGIATSDGFFAAIAALGLTGISRFILTNELVFHLVAGTVIGFFGLKIFFSKYESNIADTDTSSLSLPHALGSAFLMTLTNPLTILFFVTAFAALKPSSGFDPISGLIAVVCVFLGSFAWYLGVVATVSHFHHAINDRDRMLIDKTIGIFLILVSVWEILQAL